MGDIFVFLYLYEDIDKKEDKVEEYKPFTFCLL